MYNRITFLINVIQILFRHKLEFQYFPTFYLQIAQFPGIVINPEIMLVILLNLHIAYIQHGIGFYVTSLTEIKTKITSRCINHPLITVIYLTIETKRLMYGKLIQLFYLSCRICPIHRTIGSKKVCLSLIPVNIPDIQTRIDSQQFSVQPMV